MAHPWMYGYRQYLPPDDLPEDFAEGQDDGEEDDDELRDAYTSTK